MNNRIINDITNFIFVADRPQKADIIFIPGGSFAELPEYAAQLYKDGFVNKILPSGGVSIKLGKFAGVKSKQDIYNKDYQTECDFYTDVLYKNGVTKSAIFTENKSGYTIENAKFSRIVADENDIGINTAIIVCKSFHARRCLIVYQMAFPDTKLLVCPVDVENISCDNWYTFEHGIDRVLGELSRCGNQFVGDIKKFLNSEFLAGNQADASLNACALCEL